MGGSVHTLRKHKILVVDIKDITLTVNADKTKYLVMSRDQNAGWSCIIKTDNWSFVRV